MTKTFNYSLILFCIICFFYTTAKVNAQCSAVPVSSLALSITQTSAQISFTCCQGGTYYLEYGQLGFTPGTTGSAGAGGTLVTMTVGANSYTITGLTAGTAYDVYMRRNCSGSTWSPNSTKVNFSTAPNCNTAQVISCSTFYTVSPPTGQGAWFSYCSIINATYLGKEVMYSFTPTVSGMHVLLSQPFSGNFSEPGFFFKAASAGCDNLNWNCIGEPYGNGGVYQFSFGPLTAGTQYYILADETNSTLINTPVTFRIECPYCPRPTNVSVSGKTPTSISLSWTNNANIVEYGPQNFIPGTGAAAGANGTIVTVSGTSATINNLSPNTNYQFYVRNNCGANCSPNSQSLYAYTLPCPVVNAYQGLGTTMQVYGGPGNYNSYPGCFNSTPGSEAFFSFIPPSSGYFNVNISNDPSVNYNFLTRLSGASCGLTGYSCMSPVSTVNNTSTYLWGPLNAGSTYNMLFDVSDTSNSFWPISFIISCPSPSSPTVSNVQPNSVKLSWTCSSCPSSVYLEYGPKGFTPGTGATAGTNGTVISTASSPYIITGLTADTRYDIYLRSSCGGNFTANTTVTTFRTAVDCATAPVLNCGDFFMYSGNQSDPVSQGPHSAWTVSGCGNNYNTNKEQIYRFTPSVSGNYSILCYYGVAGSTGYLYASNFYYKVAGSACTDTGWTCIGTEQSNYNSPNWFPVTNITLPSLVAGTTYLILIDGLINPYHSFNVLCRLDCPNTCGMPRIYSVTQTTPTSAEVKMYCDTCFGNLILEFGPAGFTPGSGATAGAGGTTIAVSTFPYTVTGLASGVTYDFYARHNCGSGSFSLNSTKVTKLICNVSPSSITSNAPNNTICSGSSITLTQGGGALATGGSFKWYTGSCGGTLVGTGNSITVSPTVYTTYYVRAEASCGNSFCWSLGVNVTTVAVPTATINPSGNVNLCSTSGNILQANTGTGLTYQWKKNNVNIAGATSSNYTVTASGTYTVVVTNSCGSATSTGTVVTLSTAIPAIPAGISATGGNTKMCPGDTKVYSISTVTGATSYTWTPPIGATITAGQGTKTVTVNYTAAFTVSDTIRVKANNACGSSAQRTLKITRNTPSTPSAITGSAFGVCNLSNVSYSITIVAGMTYSWSFNVGTANIAGGQGTNAITASFGAGYGTGSLKVNASNACGASAYRTLSIKATPATPASITGATSVCVNQQGVPYSISPITSATNYTWSGPTGSHVSDGTTTSTGTNLITTATNVTVNYGNTAGKINARANNSCGSGSYKNITVTFTCRESGEMESALENQNELGIIIQPNPSSGIFEMMVPSVQSKNSEIKIYSPDGRLIKKQTAETNNPFTIDLTQQADGIYFIHALVDGQLLSMKIVKQ